MKVYNRSAITVTYKQPFKDWINQLDPENPIDFETYCNSATYLTNPDVESLDKHIKKYYATIFESELESMWSDDEDWPQNRTYELFCEWFRFEISEWIYDLSKKPLNS